MLEPSQDRVGREDLDPGRRQLDRQGHPMQSRADRRNRRGVLVGDREAGPDGHGPLDEQAHGRVLSERLRIDGSRATGQLHPLAARQVLGIGWRGETRNRILLLARDAQRGSAGDDDLEPIGRAQQVGDDRGRVGDLLEVVEHQEQPAVVQPLGERVHDRTGPAVDEPDGGGDPRSDEHRVADRLERHEEGAVRESAGNLAGKLERESRLAGPARSGQGQQARRREQARGLIELAVAPDECRQLGR